MREPLDTQRVDKNSPKRSGNDDRNDCGRQDYPSIFDVYILLFNSTVSRTLIAYGHIKDDSTNCSLYGSLGHPAEGHEHTLLGRILLLSSREEGGKPAEDEAYYNYSDCFANNVP